MALHPPEHIVYGPVRSRRLGGVAWNQPAARRHEDLQHELRVCQYGWTRGAARYRGEGVGWPTPQAVETAVSARLHRAAANDELIDRITIAGHGEPTRHPELGEIAERLCAARSHRAVDPDCHPLQLDDLHVLRRTQRASTSR